MSIHMDISVTPIILSGGSGTRLWPLSRKDRPKQFLPIFGKHSMLQETIIRLNGIENTNNPIIVCNENHRFLVAHQCNELGVNPTIILEPDGRNSAPAITVAAIQSLKEFDNTFLLVLSADHKIENVHKFHLAINAAKKIATKKKLVTFGVKPSSPNTGYGYIKRSTDKENSLKVEKFVEKPDLEKAKKYCSNPSYLWNSGIFMFTAECLLDELKKINSEIYTKSLQAIEKASIDFDFIRLDKESFKSCPSDSIDYALMEKSKNVYVVPIDIGWSDLGTFNSLIACKKPDINGNIFEGDIVSFDTNNSYISSSDKLVATIGITDMTIINTKDALLVSKSQDSDKVRDIVNTLNEAGRLEHIHHRKVFRPWGWYDTIEGGNFFQVKRLHLNPHSKLSLQKHKYRSEHWVIVSGNLIATKGNKEINLVEGESIFIPLGEIHSLENKKSYAAEVIEVQSGKYLGEDDIVRLSDIYGRHK